MPSLPADDTDAPVNDDTAILRTAAASACGDTRRILDAVTDAIVLTDAAGVLTYANAAAEQVLGLQASAVPGRSYEDPRWHITAHDGDDFPHDELPFARVQQTRRAAHGVTHAIVHPDGRRVIISVNAAPLLDAAGEFAGMVATIRDVTEAQAEQDRLAQLAALVASSADAMVGLDRDGRVVSWNEAAETMYWYTAAEILGQPGCVFVPERLRGEFEDLRVAMREGAGRCTIEALRRRKDGTEFPASISVAPMRARNGAIIGSAAVIRDNTGRREFEERLRFQARLLDSVQEAVAAIGADGRYMYLNGRAEELFGWSPERVLGRHYTEIVRRGFPEEVETLIHRCLEHGESWVGELLVRDPRAPDADELPALLTLAPIHDEAERVVGVVGLLSDLRRVRSLEEQLGHAQKMEAVGRLAGGVAHDFNNVLTAIQGHAQLALEDVTPGGRMAEDLHEILRSAERATTLTRHLLAFSRRQVLQPRVVEVSDVVHGMDRMLRRLIGEDVELVNDCPPAVGSVLVDPVQLEQVLLNLVMNARDAMPAGGRITLRAATDQCRRQGRYRERGRQRPYVVVSVSDTGCGIPRDVQQRIFEPFFTTKAPGKGSGLGLSTAYGIVEQSGGFIRVASEEGAGSTFSVHLPRVAAPLQPHRVNCVTTAADDGTETVLLAEDEDTVRRLTQRILQARGYRVLEAPDGAAALELAITHPGRIDVLVTDIVMPRMNGLQLVAALRARRPDLAVLLMSGYSEDVVEQRGCMPPDSIFLGKPFTPHALATAVRDALAACGTRLEA